MKRADVIAPDVVLAKLFKVNELLRAQKKENLLIDEFKLKINHTGKEILRNLLNNDSINQRSLAGTLDVSPQAVSECIKKLESLDLVTKQSGTQKNENLISLTDFGRDCATELNKKIIAHSNKALKDFTDDELLQLYNLLNKIG